MSNTNRPDRKNKPKRPRSEGNSGKSVVSRISLDDFLSTSSTEVANNTRRNQNVTSPTNDDMTVATWITSATNGTIILGRRRISVRRMVTNAIVTGALFSGTMKASNEITNIWSSGAYQSDLQQISAIKGDDEMVSSQTESIYSSMNTPMLAGNMVSLDAADAATRLYQLRQIFSDVSDPATLVLGNETPQNAALNWIATIDSRQLPLDDPHLIQRYTLAVLYFSTNANEWPRDGWNYDHLPDPLPPLQGNGGWKKQHYFLSDRHECEWNDGGGVRSCNKKGFVTDLSLWNNLRGHIPNEIGALTRLKVMYLSRNQLVGTIPESIGNCAKMAYLGLAHNRLSGTVPSHAFVNLLRLEMAALEKNEIIGNIRRVDPLCQLKVDAEGAFGAPKLGGRLKILTADCEQIAMWKSPEVICGCCTKCYRA